MRLMSLLPTLILVLLVSTTSRVAAGEVDDTVAGILARADALFSGRMKYRRVSGFRGQGEDSNAMLSLVFTGNSWRLEKETALADVKNRILQKPGVEIDLSKLTGNLEVTESNHGEKFVRYNVTPQLDGKPSHAASVSKSKPLRAETLQTPPVFAGTFWFGCSTKYLRENKTKGKKLPDVVVNGARTQVLEWEVHGGERAFHATDAKTANGGHLRLYVAPQFGYALPRIEYVDKDGNVNASFDSFEFVDRGNGLYLPRRCKLQYYDTRDTGFYLEFELLEVSGLNTSIADNEFVIEIPAGTIVSDARSGTHSTWFEVKDKKSIPDDLTDVIALPSWFSLKRTPGWAIGLGVAAGLSLAALVSFVLWRRRAARKETKP